MIVVPAVLNTVAVKAGSDAVSFVKLRSHVDRLAKDLSHRRGPVAILARNDIPTVVAILAALAVERPAALLSVVDPDPEQQRKLRLLGDVDIIIAGNVFASDLPANPADLHPDTALIFFTSGTTGGAKGVQLSRECLTLSIENNTRQMNFDPAQQQYIMSPLSHVFATLSQLLPALSSGTSCELVPSIVSLRPRLLEDRLTGTLSAVPSQLQAILRATSTRKGHVEKVSQIVSSGGFFAPELRRALADRFPNARLVNGYGLTEAPRILSITSDDPEFFSRATGRTSGGAQASLSAQGTLKIAGALCMLGYLGDPLPCTSFDTGDLMDRDDTSLYTLRGRIDDLVNVGGERVNLAEIDAVLAQLDGVLEAASFTSLGRFQEPVLCACLVLSHERIMSCEAIRKQLSKYISWPTVPTRFFQSDRLPRTQTGKVVRGALENGGLKPLF